MNYDSKKIAALSLLPLYLPAGPIQLTRKLSPRAAN
jgi:hypothetical protein